MNKKMITKKNQSKFFNKVKSILFKKIKHVEGGCIGYKYRINTKYGNLYITIHDELYNLYSIFMRFDNPDLAKEKFNCNPYTGVYNLHEKGMSYCLDCFNNILNEV